VITDDDDYDDDDNNNSSKSLRKYLSDIPGKQEIKEIQKKKQHAHYGKYYCHSTAPISRAK
jgi:hypothetical protein